MGEYNHTLDAKGRLIVPSKLREGLGESFVVTKGLDGCLFAYGLKEWDIFADKLRVLPMADKKTRQFTRFFLAGADTVTLDKMGRILLSANHRQYASLDKEVVLVGVGDRVEIWSKDRWEGTVSFEDMDEIAEHMLEIGIGI